MKNLDLHSLTDFEQKILTVVSRVPKGKVTTYKLLAKAVDAPKAARAVGNALHKNPCAPLIPCHRVVKTSGALGGYGGGEDKKIQLLRQEGVYIDNYKISNLEKILFNF